MRNVNGVLVLTARANVHGNREQLVVNIDTKEYHIVGWFTHEFGVRTDEIAIRKFYALKKAYDEEGYKQVSGETVRAWREEYFKKVEELEEYFNSK